MKKIIDYKFRTSVSREGYPDKETARACLSAKGAKAVGRKKMAFKEEEVTVNEFVNYATNGYAFCNLFQFNETDQYKLYKKYPWAKAFPVYRRGPNKGFFKLEIKSDEFFRGAQTVFVDIDDTSFTSLPDYINNLTYTPTIVYPSFSDCLNKKGKTSRRFRLVYVFDKVLDRGEFEAVTQALYEKIEKDTEEPIADNCGARPSQYMNGTYSKETYTTDWVYDVTDFRKKVELTAAERGEMTDFSWLLDDETDEIEGKCGDEDDFDKTAIEEIKPKKGKKTVKVSDEIYRDSIDGNYEKFIRKWFAKGMRYVTKTEFKEEEFAGYFYKLTEGTDYCELYYFREKVKDGEERRKKLYRRAALRRLINPDITPNELFYNLVVDCYKFFDNSDGVLTADLLLKKVESAFSLPIDEIRKMNTTSTTFVINPYMVKEKFQHKARAMARREIMDMKIETLYDESISVSENLKKMEEGGFKVSKTRLYKWIYDYRIQTVKSNTVEELKGYDPKLSLRDNAKRLGCTIYQVRKTKKLYEERVHPGQRKKRKRWDDSD